MRNLCMILAAFVVAVCATQAQGEPLRQCEPSVCEGLKFGPENPGIAEATKFNKDGKIISNVACGCGVSIVRCNPKPGIASEHRNCPNTTNTLSDSTSHTFPFASAGVHCRCLGGTCDCDCMDNPFTSVNECQ